MKQMFAAWLEELLPLKTRIYFFLLLEAVDFITDVWLTISLMKKREESPIGRPIELVGFIVLGFISVISINSMYFNYLS